MNKVAEELTGWQWREACGKPLAVVFNIINEVTRQPCENPVSKGPVDWAVSSSWQTTRF